MAINIASGYTAVANNFILNARLTERDESVMTNLVRQINMRKGVNQIDLPTFGSVSVAALTDGVDLANPQSFAPSSSTFTASERGGMIVITDKAQRESQDQVGTLAARELGHRMLIRSCSPTSTPSRRRWVPLALRSRRITF